MCFSALRSALKKPGRIECGSGGVIREAISKVSIFRSSLPAFTLKFTLTP
jgi:hypothetical protein